MIMRRLKEETTQQHEALERRIALPATQREYERLLARFWGIYAPLEARLAQCSALAEVLGDIAQRYKEPLLRADLATLGWDKARIALLAQCAELPTIKNTAQALGCLYVLEGATLGGQYISKQIGALEVSATDGGRFFASYGDDVGSMWRAFGASLERYCARCQVEDEIVGAACATFTAFTRWFEHRDREGS